MINETIQGRKALIFIGKEKTLQLRGKSEVSQNYQLWIPEEAILNLEINLEESVEALRPLKKESPLRFMVGETIGQGNYEHASSFSGVGLNIAGYLPPNLGYEIKNGQMGAGIDRFLTDTELHKMRQVAPIEQESLNYFKEGLEKGLRREE